MKLQFKTSTLLLAIGFIAVCLGGVGPWAREVDLGDAATIRTLVLFWSPVLPPFVFGAYALGRRALTPSVVIAFAVTQGIALAGFLLLVYGWI